MTPKSRGAGPSAGVRDRSPRFESLEQRRLLSGAGESAAGGDAAADTASAPRLVENLDRGVIAIDQGAGRVYVGWRLLGLDPENIAFNVYRQEAGEVAVKVNAAPITQTTDFVDTGVDTRFDVTYSVRPVINGVEGEAEGRYALAGGSTAAQPFHAIPLQKPADVFNPFTNQNVTYSANDASVGDLDGDGQYEVVLKWDPSDSGDNNAGHRSNVFIDAYEFDGTLLWRIDLGRNVRAGPHYTQFQVWDLDSDGRAEVAMRTAPGTVDGEGNFVLLPGDDPAVDYRNSGGYILTGPEYLTVFDGETGGELASVPFEPERGNVAEWGDTYGNRVDRHLAGVAYLDGREPSLIFGRGYYGPQSGLNSRNEIAAYDYRDGQLTLRWIFEARTNGPNADYIAQGAHSLSIADVDFDGFDEVVYGASVIDHDGTGLYSTGLGHGDALHVSDLDPTRPGLEVFMPHEGPSQYQSNGRDAGASLRPAERIAGVDPKSAAFLLAQIPSNNDVGRGVALDIDPNYVGYEMWATTNEGTRFIYNVDGTPLYPTPGNMFYNFGVWWDADPSRELLDRTTIGKWNYQWANPGRSNFDLDPNGGSFYPIGVTDINGTKANPALSGDILGDWREEVIWPTIDSSALHVYSTTIPANGRLVTLMHDTQYRSAIAWQNSGYNQPPHPSFWLGGHTLPDLPRPDVEYVEDDGFTRVVRVDKGKYEAELANLVTGTNVEVRPERDFSGTGYVNFDASGVLEFANVDGGEGGPTQVDVLHALGPSGNPDRQGLLTVNGVTTDISFDNTGTWDSFVAKTLTLDLLPGPTNTIRFEATGDDLANIDYIQVDLPRIPQPWQVGYFGNERTGDATFADGVFSITNSGAGITGQADAFRFVYQELPGDAQLVARLESSVLFFQDSGAGLMVRSDLDENATNASLLVGNFGAAARLQSRAQNGAETVIDATQMLDGRTWLRLARAGDTVTAFLSADGANWDRVGATTVPLGDAAFAGLAFAAGFDNVTADASFSNVEIAPLPVTAALNDVVVNGGASQRSMIRDFDVTFDAPVLPGPDAFRLTDADGNVVPLVVEQGDADGTAWRLVPTGGSVVNGSLVDGTYTLSVDAGLVSDEFGRAVSGGATSIDFHRLFGDSDGDGSVSLADFGAFRAAFGSSTGDALFNDALDADGDGVIALADFGQFRARFGQTLIP